jgi:hypothetical protein
MAMQSTFPDAPVNGAAISAEANLRQQVKPRRGGRNQNRCLMKGRNK